MGNKNTGTSNKKETKQKKNMMLVIIIAVILLIVAVVVVFKPKENMTSNSKQKADFSKIIEKAETAIVLIESSDKTKCENCNKIKDYLDSKKISYLVYDVEDYSKEDFTQMLKSIEINPPDFGYPAVIYMKDGKLYANVINLSNTSVLDEFIKTYDLGNVK